MDDDDWAESGEATPSASRKTSGCAWAFVFLMLVVVVVEMLSMQVVGRNANQTFQFVTTKK